MTTYPTKGSPQAGFEVAAGSTPSGEGAPSSGPVATLSAADDQRLRDAVIALRFRQPDEFDVFARMAQIEKDLADVKAIVDLQTEVILRLRGAA